MHLPPFSFAVLDTETTGFIPRVHRVIEYADIVAGEGKIESTFEQLFAVEEEVPPHVQVLTRIRPAMLQGMPIFSDRRAEIQERLNGVDLLVGQNLSFDIGMLRGEGIDLADRPWVDTSLLAAFVFPEFRSFSLPYISGILHLTHEPAHRALGDVRATLELFARIWERLLELPEKELQRAKEVMERSTPGYRMLFNALPRSKSRAASWMQCRVRNVVERTDRSFPLPPPQRGTVALQEEGLHPQLLQYIVNAAAQDKRMTHWIAVKNLEQTLGRLSLPEGARAIHPPQLLLNPDALEALAKQATLTPEEALLSLKVEWCRPRTRFDIALHGSERDIWSGRLACAATCAAYARQFEERAGALLLDHRQLLAFLAAPSHAAHRLLTEHAHIIIDDASMLEDTATKAYGHELSLDDMRAGSSGDPSLTHITNLLALWSERTRANEDQHFLTTSDYAHPETAALKKLVEAELNRTDLPVKTQEQLREAAVLLSADLLPDHIVWINRLQDGRLIVNAVLRHVDTLLKTLLYDRFATTLLVPKGCQAVLPEILPTGVLVAPAHTEALPACSARVLFQPEQGIGTFLRALPPGKSVVLAASKRLIEQMFIEYTELLEEQGITMICQGLSGGQGRMEAEFLAAESPAVLLVTPYMYEGLEFPEGTIDRLVIDTVPFDAPSHAVLGRRKERYRSAFMEYLLPRAEYRLFRLIRTFCRHRKADAEVLVFDSRLQTKEYGVRLQKYLSQFANGAQPTVEPPAPSFSGSGRTAPSVSRTSRDATKKPATKKVKSVKKKSSGPQLALPL